MSDQDGKEFNPRQRLNGRVRRVRTGVMTRLRNYLLAGLLITAPIGITLYLLWVFVSFMDRLVGAVLPAHYLPQSYLPFDLPGIGLVIVLVSLTLIGAVTRGLLGRIFLHLSQRVLARMPVVRSIYGALTQIFETVLARQSTAFREVVLVEYPRRGIWAIGFVTGVTEGEVQNLTAQQMVNVFLPTTPNPTSGFLLFLPRGDLFSLKMTVEEGIKMVVSGGIVTPPDRRPVAEQEAPVIFAGPEAPPEPHES